MDLTLLALVLGAQTMPPCMGGGAGGAPPEEEQVVDVFAAVTDGSTGISTVSATYADIAGLTATVTGTEVGDVLVITANATAYSSSSTAAVAFTILVDGVNVRSTDDIRTHSVDTNSKPVSWQWVHTVTADDITAGDTIVKPQWRRAGGSVQCNLANGTDGVTTFSVVRVRPPA